MEFFAVWGCWNADAQAATAFSSRDCPGFAAGWPSFDLSGLNVFAPAAAARKNADLLPFWRIHEKTVAGDGFHFGYPFTKAAVAQRTVALGGLINGGCDRVSRLKNSTASALASGIRARSALWNARHSRHWRGCNAILTSENRPELDMGGGTSAQQVDSTHVAFGVRRSAFGVRRSAFGVQYLPLLLKSACNSLPYPCAPSNSKPRAS